MNLTAFPSEEREVSRDELNGPQRQSPQDHPVYRGDHNSNYGILKRLIRGSTPSCRLRRWRIGQLAYLKAGRVNAENGEIVSLAGADRRSLAAMVPVAALLLADRPA